MLQEITQFIRNRSIIAPTFGPVGGWVIGDNLFPGHIPVRNASGIEIAQMLNGRYVAVLENAGGAVLADVGGVVKDKPPSAVGDTTYFPKYVEKAIQLLNRNCSYITARRDAEDLYEALHQTAGWNLPQVPVIDGGTNRQYTAIVIDAYGPPAPIQNPGDAGFYLFSTNYLWKIEEVSC